MLVRGIEPEILPYCQRENIGTIVYSPMRSGLLSGKMTRERVENLPADDWRHRNPDYQEPNLSRNLRLVELLRELGNRYGRTAGEVAIAWTLRHPAVTAAIVGVRKPGQVAEVAGAAELHLSEADMAEIEQFFATEAAPVTR
jgi:aryl-alcohol dehydrogenase-like predicted oxidoreductase